jgi:hypothetical protein
MPKPRSLSLLLATPLLAASLAGGAAEEKPRPVVVELFTSQGCSSCPAADRLLTDLGEEGLDGIEVIPLSFHVDYWNYIGWTDPFSSAEWSQRQRRYARAFEADRVYTPQLVVDGHGEGVGSDRREVRRLVAEAAARPARATVSLHSLGGPAAPGVGIEARLDSAVERGADLVLAVVETGLTTEVGSGENARRTLRNDHVVRRLFDVARLEPGDTVRLELPLELDPAWRRDRLGVVVLAQDPASLEVLGAGSLDL